MAWLLDTSTWIKFLKGGHADGQAIASRLEQLHEAEIRLCSVVKAELWYGAEKYPNREARLARLTELFLRYDSLPFDDDAARRYAAVRHQLEAQGQIIGPHDLQIAAICLAHGLTLVSTDTDEFMRVPGLRVEDWTKV